MWHSDSTQFNKHDGLLTALCILSHAQITRRKSKAFSVHSALCASTGEANGSKYYAIC